VAYEFVDADGRVQSLPHEDLARRAFFLAAQLLAAAPPVGRPSALLLYPPGLDLVIAVYACLVAGVPAIPAYPADPWRPEVGLRRLKHLVADAEPSIVLAHPLLRPQVDLLDGPARRLATVCVDDWATASREERPAVDSRSDVALVQYTSGSTRAPRGVVVSHANLEANLAAIADRFDLTERTRGVIWLPPYHDMGLIGGIFAPLFVGFPVRLISPVDFVRTPMLWLRQIADFGATASGGPNFAYDLCVRRRRPTDDDDLDLSSWTLAFNGAEPVRRQTMERFAEAFASAGFRPSAFLPCYGLAEATLLVSARRWNRATPASGGRAGVSCGRPVAKTEVVAVDPASRERVTVGTEGELWIRGPGVTRGYWSETPADAFGELDGKRFLRTGDLGYLDDGELVVTGRTKDVIVQRGVKHHASDLESAAVEGDPRLRPAAAAFAVETASDAIAVLVVESRARDDAATVAAAARARTLETTGLRLDVVVVAPPGTIPKTSSGKVQRGLCRTRLLDGEYDAHIALAPEGARFAPVSAGAPGNAALVELVCGVFAAVCDVADCGPDDTLLDLGGDSVRAAEAAAVLESALDVDVSLELVLGELTPARVAGALAERWEAAGRDGPGLARRLADLTGSPAVQGAPASGAQLALQEVRSDGG
jgi:acyl-CoA synthetase (AMP-forming)/AMP-acid ligase II